MPAPLPSHILWVGHFGSTFFKLKARKTNVIRALTWLPILVECSRKGHISILFLSFFFAIYERQKMWMWCGILLINVLEIRDLIPIPIQSQPTRYEISRRNTADSETFSDSYTTYGGAKETDSATKTSSSILCIFLHRIRRYNMIEQQKRVPRL